MNKNKYKYKITPASQHRNDEGVWYIVVRISEGAGCRAWDVKYSVGDDWDIDVAVVKDINDYLKDCVERGDLEVFAPDNITSTIGVLRDCVKNLCFGGAIEDIAYVGGVQNNEIINSAVTTVVSQWVPERWGDYRNWQIEDIKIGIRIVEVRCDYIYYQEPQIFAFDYGLLLEDDLKAAAIEYANNNDVFVSG